MRELTGGLRGTMFVAVLLIALLLAACGNGDDAPEGEPRSTPVGSSEPRRAPAGTAEPGATPATAVDSGFQVGPAITVEPNYEPPDDHVPSTGAHLPANGKPTLVYVDAIW